MYSSYIVQALNLESDVNGFKLTRDLCAWWLFQHPSRSTQARKFNVEAVEGLDL
jgi:hypothetical protein